MSPGPADRSRDRGLVVAVLADRSCSLEVRRPHGKCAATHPIQPVTLYFLYHAPFVLHSLHHPVSLFILLSFTSSPAFLLDTSGKHKWHKESGWWLITS